MKKIIIAPANITGNIIRGYNGNGWDNHNARYHGEPVQTKFRDRSGGNPFLIGIEVEKEDSTAYGSVAHQRLFDATKWKKENDGSLGSGGFELVSPIFSLTRPDTLLHDLSQPVIQYLLNADCGPACGNHFHVSQHKGASPADLLNGLQAYIPLLYAIYEKRMNNTYCRAHNVSNMISNPTKYSAVHLSPYNTMEFRIFPALKNVKQLQFRLNLLNAMLENSKLSAMAIINDMKNPQSDIFQAMIEAYNTEEKYKKLLLRYVKHLQYASNSLNNGIDESIFTDKYFAKIRKYFKQVQPDLQEEQVNDQPTPENAPGQMRIISGCYHICSYLNMEDRTRPSLSLHTDSSIPNGDNFRIELDRSSSINYSVRAYTKNSVTRTKLDLILWKLEHLINSSIRRFAEETVFMSFEAIAREQLGNLHD